MAIKKKKPYASKHDPTWCPGCGNFAIWLSIQKAFETLKFPQHKTLVVFGVGCSGNMANTLGTYGWHSLHGRGVPTAVGAKLANDDLNVLVTGGDGDGYGEGLSHFLHAVRGNANITYIVHNNSVYGLTTGQAAPTATKGFKGKSTPFGIIEEPVNPIALAISNGAGFVARGFSGKPSHLTEMFIEGIKHPGFSLIDVFQPCVTFNAVNTYTYYNSKIRILQEDPEYDTTDRMKALGASFELKKLPIGIYYQNAKRQDYGRELGYLKAPLVAKDAAQRDVSKLYGDFR